MVFIDMHGENNDNEAAEYIRHNLALDLLVDLTSHTYKVTKARSKHLLAHTLALYLMTHPHTSHTYKGRVGIAALKPADIVINYLGFPGRLPSIAAVKETTKQSVLLLSLFLYRCLSSRDCFFCFSSIINHLSC